MLQYNSDSLRFYYRTCRSRFYKPFTDRNEVDMLDPIEIDKQEEVLDFSKIEHGKSDMDIDAMKVPLSDKLLFKAVRNSILEHKAERKSNYRIVDRYDPQFKSEDQGHLGKLQMTHFNTRCKNFKIREHYQISRIRFNNKKGEWEGVQLEGKGDFFIVKLKEKWVMKNFPKYWEFFKKRSIEGDRKFLVVPVGDVIDVIPTMDISKNPCMKYLQDKRDICVFASLASVLHYNGMLLEADIVFNMRKEFTCVFKQNPSRVVQTTIQLINEDKRFKKFRKYYRYLRINNDHDIFANKIAKGEFKLIVIKSDDNQMSHAVCVDNDFIFDSNSPKCLPMSQEGINCCCRKDHYFTGIVFGYYFQFQPIKHHK